MGAKPIKMFAISRADGRSDAQVICELVRNAAPETVFSYDQLAGALSVGSRRVFDREKVLSVVSRSFNSILRDTQRALLNVAGVGYRVARANEHEGHSRVRKRRSDIQLRRALLTLQQVRWDEMDQASRTAHEGTLVLVSVLMSNQAALERRQSKTEGLIRSLIKTQEERSIA
jgi:hypothetical protein